MSWEIERRFLVRVQPDVEARLPEPLRLRQGYIRRGEPTVRIRTGERRGAVLTCKEGRGIRRREVETVVPDDVARALLEAAGTRVLEKDRHELGPWVLDRFCGALEGLWLLEVELEREDQPLPSVPDGVEIMDEVTEHNGFTSAHLASLTDDERRALVASLYREVGR